MKAMEIKVLVAQDEIEKKSRNLHEQLSDKENAFHNMRNEKMIERHKKDWDINSLYACLLRI